MTPTSSTPGRRTGSRGGPEAGRGRRGVLAGLGALAVALVAGGWLLPLWQATLHAPQYPGGLVTIAYGHQVTGDLNEINALNHYVGLGVFDPSDVPEMRLWPLALAVAVVAVVVGLALGRGWGRRLALAYLWGLPLGVLAAIQFRLHEFGQDVEPGAAFRMEPFTPWVIGRTTVWNFETWAWPGLGLLAIVLAATVVTFGPRLGRRGAGQPARDDADGGSRGGATRASVVAVLAAVLAVPGLVVPSGAALASDGHDHGAHDHGAHDRGSHDHGAHDHGTEPSDQAPAPQVGPEGHPPMPSVVEHPPAGELQPLIDATDPGGTLVLPPGTYTGPAVVDRPITIEGVDLPIVQGDGTGSVLTVRADDAVVRGLVVRGSGVGPHENPAGIRVEADGVLIEGNVVEDSYMGLAVDSAAAVKLVDNHLHGRPAPLVDDGHAAAHDDHDPADHGADDHPAHDHGAEAHPGHDPAAHDHGAHDHGAHDHAAHDHGGHAAHAATSSTGGPRGDGVWLHDVDHVLVRGNHIMGVRDGIYLSFGTGALIDSNHVHHSRYAVHSMFARDFQLVQNHFAQNLSGAVLMYGEDALLLRNHIEDNRSAATGFGTILKDITGVEAVQNLLVDNRISVHLDGPSEGVFTANTIARSSVGLQAHSSARGTFTGNSFVENAIQVLPLGSGLANLAWSDRGFGNFWDTYRGYDARGEGKGAVPHTEGGAVDRLLARNPELLAIADSPALRLLRSVEERWGRRAPVLVDELPLTVPLSPALPATTAVGDARVPATALGLVLLLPVLVLLARRPRRRGPASRRSPRAVHA
jgi:nitrous oxidase accessory protein